MADIRPFTGIHYTPKAGELSNLIAPPYDVLDEPRRSALAAASPNNIVRVDLPWMPPKSLGPQAVYDQAAVTLGSWLKSGILTRDTRAALYPYAQTYQHAGKTFHRRGFFALVKLSPFGAGKVVPHEKTYAGPIEDRLRLMQTTAVQLSPIFGLFPDPHSKITHMLYGELGLPLFDATLEDVRNQVWAITDSSKCNHVIEAIGSHPIYVADGHHRYTTALNYRDQVERNHGSPLPVAHPANWCLFNLVGMQDDGLLILPTHRLIGGLQAFDMDTLRAALAGQVELTPAPFSGENLGAFAKSLADGPPHTLGLYDGKTAKAYTLRLTNLDVLKSLEPERSDAWRKLDVAVLQRYLLDEVIAPKFAKGELIRGYTPDADTIARDVDGSQYQIALLLRPTPLHALEELGKAGDVMPQKSTYFFPKLATGMMMYALE